MIRFVSRLAAPPVAFVLLAGMAFAQPSAFHMALATEVALNSGITRSFDGVTEPLLEELRKMPVARPDIKKDLDAVIEMLKPELELQKKRMVTATAAAFARNMTEAELRDIVTFFKSPVGRKYVDKQPAVFDDIMREMTKWSHEVEEYVLVRAKAEMLKRGHSLE